jgi:hypothetical protein
VDKNVNVKMIRGFGYYLPRALRFYNLKSENLTPVIFLITLLFYFIANFFIITMIPDIKNTINELISVIGAESINIDRYLSLLLVLINYGLISMEISILANFLVGIFASIFLIAFIKELKGEAYSIKNGFKLLFNNFFKIVFLSFVFSLSYNFLKEFFEIPGFIFYSVYLFYMCYALDLEKKAMSAFKASKTITKGRRMEIFGIIILFKIVSFLAVNFLTAMIFSLITSILSAKSNSLIEIFITAFMSATIFLMETKLVAMIYFDIQYGWKPEEII